MLTVTARPPASKATLRIFLGRRRAFPVGSTVQVRIACHNPAVPRLRPAVALVLAAALLPAARSDVETLRAVSSLSPIISGRFEDPIGCAETTTGELVVLDRRAHTVYAVSADRKSVRKILEIGSEQGRVLSPAVLDLSADDIFAVADALDAITTDRPYRPARTWEDARVEILQGRGSHFDPTVVDAFLEIFDDLQGLSGAEQPFPRP